MNFETLRDIKNENERVNELYNLFNEDIRLNRSKASRVEFLTTIKYINSYLNENSKILDIGAGAGEYSLYFAKEGYTVEALELAKNNIELFEKKITQGLKINLRQGNALDLSYYKDKSFDIVLVMGPLYHLEKEEDKLLALKEAIRVCKDDGIIITTFISNDMVILTEFAYDNSYFKNGEFDKENFKVENFPFVFHTLDEAKNLINKTNLEIINIIAQDGVSELMAGKINQLDDEDYMTYLNYHFYCCEKPEMLGMSNHIMFLLRKKG